MSIVLPLDSMSVAEKMEAMETIWSSLCQKPGDVPTSSGEESPSRKCLHDTKPMPHVGATAGGDARENKATNAVSCVGFVQSLLAAPIHHHCLSRCLTKSLAVPIDAGVSARLTRF